MRRRISSTVFYSRKTLVAWVLAVAALFAAVFGYLLSSERNRLTVERTRLRTQVRELTEEKTRLRVAKQMLEMEVAKLRKSAAETPPPEKVESEKVEPEKKPPPPEEAVADRVFPVGKAVAVVPDQMYVTLSRIDGNRARIRIAALQNDEKGNRSRTLSPGQTWKFESGEHSYSLLFHSVRTDPPGARLSIRKLN